MKEHPQGKLISFSCKLKELSDKLICYDMKVVKNFKLSQKFNIPKSGINDAIFDVKFVY